MLNFISFNNSYRTVKAHMHPCHLHRTFPRKDHSGNGMPESNYEMSFKERTSKRTDSEMLAKTLSRR